MESDRLKAVAKQNPFRELLTEVEKRDEAIENKATQEEKLKQEGEQCNVELAGKVESLEAEMAKKAEELANEIAATKANEAICVTP